MKSKQPKLMAGGRPDNFQTPPSALDPILPYLKKDWRIWEPSSGKGNIARRLSSEGYSVEQGDITSGEGFVSYRPPAFDCIVTNPPHSKKELFLGRCYDLGRPFALLMPLTTFDSAARQKLFHEFGVQVIFMPKRVNFETPNHEARLKVGKKSSAWFATCWICWKLDLPSQLVFTGFDEERSMLAAAS
jgi:hypothetical protein